ncbi:hypothetical protein BD769DRAFT_1679826 [Suillus cothurnatus]|nr:hypothetical protein BD769DRAFT_1679826 [Suillus cothurnatus]
MATFWTYDYVCSLHEEWKFLRRSRWTKVKALYIIARYVPFLFIITDIYLNFSPSENSKKCKILVNIYSSLGVISLTCSECFFVLRTYALWNSNRIVLVAMLSTLFAIIASFIGICFSAIATSHGLCSRFSHDYSHVSTPPQLRLAWSQASQAATGAQPVFNSSCHFFSCLSFNLTWRTSNGGMHAILVRHNIFYYACVLSAVNVLAPVMFSDPAYYSLLEDLQAFILAILATRMHLHLWHIDRNVHGSEVLVCISMSDISSADRTVTTV